jgi:hypothetical protein
MGLTIFQKLVLHALALLLWNAGSKGAARLLRGIALGHHTDSQKESLLEAWRRKDHGHKRTGLPHECAECLKDYD